MKTKYLILAFSVLLCAAIGLIIRLSYVPNGSGVDGYQCLLGGNGLNEDGYILNNHNYRITTLESLTDNADTMVKCKIEPGRMISPSEYYTPALVEKVYQGDGALKSSRIYLVETIATFPDKALVNCVQGLLPLKEGEEYIVLLHKQYTSRCYDKNDIRNLKYENVTDSAFGEYPLAGFHAFLNKAGGYANFGELKKKYNFQLDDQAQLAMYSKFRDQVLAKYN